MKRYLLIALAALACFSFGYVIWDHYRFTASIGCIYESVRACDGFQNGEDLAEMTHCDSVMSVAYDAIHALKYPLVRFGSSDEQALWELMLRNDYPVTPRPSRFLKVQQYVAAGHYQYLYKRFMHSYFAFTLLLVPALVLAYWFRWKRIKQIGRPR